MSLFTTIEIISIFFSIIIAMKMIFLINIIVKIEDAIYSFSYGKKKDSKQIKIYLVKGVKNIAWYTFSLLISFTLCYILLLFKVIFYQIIILLMIIAIIFITYFLFIYKNKKVIDLCKYHIKKKER